MSDQEVEISIKTNPSKEMQDKLRLILELVKEWRACYLAQAELHGHHCNCLDCIVAYRKSLYASELESRILGIV